MSAEFSIPKWDQIRLIGQSRSVGLTILDPFIGYLLLFNESVWSLLSLSEEALGSVELAPERTLSRFYFLYFGLTAIGLASFVYQLFCP